MSPRDQWIFTLPCDCPVGVMEGTEARDEEEAWEEMYEPHEGEEARERGVQVRLISFNEYTTDYYPQMSQQCTHGAGW